MAVTRRGVVGSMALLPLPAAAAGFADPAALAAFADGKRPVATVLLAASAGGDLVIPPGRYLIDRSLTLNANVEMQPGSVLQVAAGQTLRIAGSFAGPRAQLFAGDGRVIVNGLRTPLGYPEWWGARVDDPSFDNLPALQACLASCLHVALPPGDLHISDTWVIDKDNISITGTGKAWTIPDAGGRMITHKIGCSRIVLTGEAGRTRDVILCGVPDMRRPAGLEGFVKQPHLADFDAVRDRPARCPAPGQEEQAPCGFRFLHTWHLRHERLNSQGSPIGFYYGANVYCFMDGNSAALLNNAATGSAGDFGYGFYVDGNYRTGVFGVGGNASLYFGRFKTYIPAGLRDRSVGFAMVGGFSDTWLTEFETIGCKTGILIEGSKDLQQRTHPNVSPISRGLNQDVHIFRPTLDQPGECGVEIAKLVRYASIEIFDIYVANGGGGAPIGLYWHDSDGLVKVIGGHLYGWPNYDQKGTAVGVLAQRGSGLRLADLSVIGYPRPVVIDTVAHAKVETAILNPYERTGGTAIECAHLSDSRIIADIQGGPGSAAPFATAVNFAGRTCDFNEVVGTGLRRSGMQGLRYDGRAVIATGQVSGSHNAYTGVPN